MKRVWSTVAVLVLIGCFAALVAELASAVTEAYAAHDCRAQGYRGTYDPAQGCVWKERP